MRWRPPSPMVADLLAITVLIAIVILLVRGCR